MGKAPPAKKRATTAGGSRKSPEMIAGLRVAGGVLIAVAVVAVAVWGGRVVGRTHSPDSTPATVQAKADPVAEISLSPTTVDLGRIGQSKSVAGTITVWNVGTADLVITDVETS